MFPGVCSVGALISLNKRLFRFRRWIINHISGVMAIVLASCVVDHGFEPRSGQTKDYKIGICCLSAKHTALGRKSKDWLARNQNNVSEWGDMYIHELLFRSVRTINI